MRMQSASWSEPESTVAPLASIPPAWVEGLFAGPDARRERAGRVDVLAAGPLTLFSTSIQRALSLTADALQSRVAAAYAELEDAVSTRGRYPTRFWNFVPRPNDAMGPGLDRYMVFNAGRYDAYARRYGTPRAFGHSLATASALGVESPDLDIFCLAAEMPGSPVENPRQTSSWNYSARYGPRPPCFARATIVRAADALRLLIGGTASIVGEDSVHIGDPARQVVETVTNMTALIAAARGSAAPTAADLARLTDIRVYLPRRQDVATIESAVRTLCPAVITMEMAVAQICRPELLVEIEGVATI
jgi:chorismate lyase/3-hydroxybenzoate synthase